MLNFDFLKHVYKLQASFVPSLSNMNITMRIFSAKIITFPLHSWLHNAQKTFDTHFFGFEYKIANNSKVEIIKNCADLIWY